MDKISVPMLNCLQYLIDHHGVTYDNIPFQDATINALARRGLVKNTLMIPYITGKGIMEVLNYDYLSNC
jgi:2',3'-cyclic-nucleotide 2'-phosphodiesterase (5'-nucleotidase family)